MLRGRDRFLRTLRCDPVDRPPVWLMRQAGRTLPEFRAIRAEHDFLTVMRTPALAAEVTLQPIRRFGMDGAVVFSDILIIPEALGLRFTMEKGHGPDISPTLESRPTLRPFDPAVALGWLGDTLGIVREALGDDHALLGFAGAPFTLLCYMTERMGKEPAIGAKRLLHTEPAYAAEVLDLLADAVIETLRYQIRCGADAVQLFDTWAGELSPEDYHRFVHPVNARIVAAIRRDAPVLLYLKNGAHLLTDAIAAEPSGHAVDWRVDLPAFVRRLDALGHTRTAVQGNLDPALLLGPPEGVTAAVRQLHGALEGRPGHVFNLGHGLLPTTPIASIAAFVDAVKELAP